MVDDAVTTPCACHNGAVFISGRYYAAGGSEAGSGGGGGGASAMDDLTDADTTTVAPTASDLLKWDGTNWVPGTPTAIFITGATGSGTISNKTYEANTVPANKVLTAFESDNDNVTITVEIHVSNDSWQPADVTVSGAGATPVIVNKQNWTQVASTRIFTATANLTDAGTTGTITATMSDGDTATCTYTRALDPPLVLTAIFDTHAGSTGGDPLVQGAQVATTSATGTQTVRITGTTESHATKIWATNAGVSSSEQGSFAVTAGAFDFTINVRSSGNPGAQTATLEAAVGETDTRGTPKATTNTVTVSHTLPTFGSGSVAYPAGQEAFKAAETVDVTLAHTNIATGDTYLYSDPTGTDVIIPATTTYASPKTGVTINTAGIYRHDGSPNNFRLQITRTEQNGTVATSSLTIEIADVAPVVTIGSNTGGSALPRLRTDDGTNNYLDDFIFVVSNQKHLSTSTSSVVADAGDTSTWKPASSWTADGSSAFKREKRVADADILTGGQAANTFTWASASVTNRANTTTTTITTNPTYKLGGFQARTLTIPAWPNREADTSVLAVDTTKLTAELLSKGGAGPNGGTVQTFDNSPGGGLTPDDEVDKFCISDGADLVDDDNQFYYNKDQAAAIANSSGTAQVIVEETA